MMKIYLYFISFLLLNYLKADQPYFPNQVVFSPDNDVTTLAIDEINQRAYITYPFTPSLGTTAFVFKHIPFAVPDSPQSKYHVQLSEVLPGNSCMYGTYWKYGGNMPDFFPSHWANGSSFEIKNYMNYNYEMIHSNDSSIDEDYWYSHETCQVDGGEQYPCQEIYFKKDTNIPRRSVEVRREQWKVVQVITNFLIKSIGKPDEKYFDSMPKNWSIACRDNDLEVLYNPQRISLNLQESINVQVWLSSPPHRINGNDTVSIQWEAAKCSDCFTWTPKEFIFNIENFQKRQILTITRVKDTEETTLIPIFNGGGFDLVQPEDYPIDIE